MLEIYTRKKEAKNFASFRGPDGPIQQVRAFSSRPTDTLLKPVASSPSQSAYAEFRAKKRKPLRQASTATTTCTSPVLSMLYHVSQYIAKYGRMFSFL